MRHLLVALAVIGGACALASCARLLNDAVKTDPNGKMAAGEIQACARKASESFSRYLKNQASNAEIDASFACADRALDLFQKKARFARPNVWTLDESLAFIDSYSSQVRALDKNVVRAAFRLKRVLFGSSEIEVNAEDIVRLHGLIASVHVHAARLQPFIEVLSLNAVLAPGDPEAERQLDAAIDALAVAAKSIAVEAFGGSGRGRYAVRDLIEIAAALMPNADIKRFTALVEAAKSVLIMPPAESIGPEEWALGFEAAARLYGEKLRLSYFLKDASALDPKVASTLESMAKSAFSLARATLVSREAASTAGARRVGMVSNEGISGEEFSRLIDACDDLGWLPWGIKAESLKGLISPFLNKLLRQPGAPIWAEAERRPALGTAQLGRAEDVFADWIAGQRYVQNAAMASVAGAKEAFEPPALSVSPSRVELDFHALLHEGRPLQWAGSYVSIRPTPVAQTEAELALTNVIRWASRWTLEAYAGDRDRALDGTGLTSDETQEFYMDMRSTGIDLGLMDPRVRTAGQRSFIESTLFTSVSEGGDLLSRRAAAEFFALIISGGRVARSAYSDALERCKSDAPPDIFGRPKLLQACFNNVMRVNFALLFPHLPGFVEEMKSADDAKWSKLFKALESASRPTCASGELIERSEINVIAPVLQYAESLAVRYDVAPRDNRLSADEIWLAFPRFKNFLRKLGDGKAEGEFWQRAIFSYLIYNGRPPQTTSVAGQSEFGWWAATSWAHTLEADRISLVQLIASINIFGREKRLRAINSWYAQLSPESRDRNVSLRTDELARRLMAGAPATAATLAELFSCPGSSSQALAKLMNARSAALLVPAADGSFSARVFGQNLGREIRAVPELAYVCQPPY